MTDGIGDDITSGDPNFIPVLSNRSFDEVLLGGLGMYSGYVYVKRPPAGLNG